MLKLTTNCFNELFGQYSLTQQALDLSMPSFYIRQPYIQGMKLLCEVMEQLVCLLAWRTRIRRSAKDLLE